MKDNDFGHSEDKAGKFFKLLSMIQKIDLFFAEIMNPDSTSLLFFDLFNQNRKSRDSAHDQQKLIKELKNSIHHINWKHNPENNNKFFNSQQFLKIFTPKHRFHLGWLGNFNIGDIMFLKAIDLSFFQEVGPFEIINNPAFITDLILYLA